MDTFACRSFIFIVWSACPRSRSKVQVFEPGIYEFTGGKLISTTVNPAPEPPFNGAELGLLAHLYRGEMYRSKIWRTRLDATTNWAVATTGIALSVAFSNAGNSPLPLVLVALMALMFLAIEARRYRYFDIWRTRVRLMEVSMYGPLLRLEGVRVDNGWNEALARDYERLHFHISFWEAAGRRLRRNYSFLFAVFKGRDAALVDLRRRLRSGPCQATHGLGGVGKTRLAIEYAWRHASDYTALLFVSARSPVELRANLAGLCNPLVLNLPEQTQPEEAARVSAVFRWLGENPGWLLILDNADTQEAASGVEETLPRFRGGEVIITSRIADWSPAVQTAEPLNVLDETEAAAFLLERVPVGTHRGQAAQDTR
jgi:uncharacterized membrane protein